MSVARVAAVAFQGVEVLTVDVQVQMAPGAVTFMMLCQVNPKERVEGEGGRGKG
jgi:hypothetical protein